jgi:hypothetical protein
LKIEVYFFKLIGVLGKNSVLFLSKLDAKYEASSLDLNLSINNELDQVSSEI